MSPSHKMTKSASPCGTGARLGRIRSHACTACPLPLTLDSVRALTMGCGRPACVSRPPTRGSHRTGCLPSASIDVEEDSEAPVEMKHEFLFKKATHKLTYVGRKPRESAAPVPSSSTMGVKKLSKREA